MLSGINVVVTGAKDIQRLITGGFINNAPLLTFMSNRKNDGTFKRIRKPFSLENFNDGYIDNKGRFRVHSPNHPRAYHSGYVLRSIIAYELYNNINVPNNMDIHHIDGNKLNDSKENLVMLPHSKHAQITRTSKLHYVIRVCKNCSKQFIIKQWRLKDLSRGKYCSQTCYQDYRKNHPNYKRVTTICEHCGQKFEHIPSRKLRFCSKKCVANYRWNKRRRQKKFV